MNSRSTSPYVIPTQTHVGAVRLRVADLERSLAFYRDILGYQATTVDDGVVQLAPSSGAVDFELREQTGISAAPVHAAGLYHAAILLPSRRDLARIVRRLAEASIPFGHSDHGVSEALYLNDPDGNGLEIYADRPREQWPMNADGVAMVVDPLNFEDLLGQLNADSAPWTGMPAGTRIGHVHLRVSDLTRSRAFYVDRLGFEVMQESLRGALFISAGGYHHHLGLNVWESRGRPLGGQDAAGLVSFAVVLPSERDRVELVEHLQHVGVNLNDSAIPVVHDPDGIAVELRARE